MHSLQYICCWSLHVISSLPPIYIFVSLNFETPPSWSCDKIIIVSRITVWFFVVFARHARSQVELYSWIDRHGKLTIRLKFGLVKLFNKPGHFFIKQSMSRPEIQCQSRHNRWVVNFTWFLKGTKLVTRSVRQYGQKTPGARTRIFHFHVKFSSVLCT